MWAKVESGSVTEIYTRPKPLKIGDVQHPKNIFELWSEAELKAIGIYIVEIDNTNLKDKEYYNTYIKKLFFKKYPYKKHNRFQSETGRKYLVNESPVPSVTTILSATKDRKHLDDWRRRVGNAEADRIMNNASNVGTEMHRVLEKDGVLIIKVPNFSSINNLICIV